MHDLGGRQVLDLSEARAPPPRVRPVGRGAPRLRRQPGQGVGISLQGEICKNIPLLSPKFPWYLRSSSAAFEATAAAMIQLNLVQSHVVISSSAAASLSRKRLGLSIFVRRAYRKTPMDPLVKYRGLLYSAQSTFKKDPGRARQNSLATAGTNFTKPGAQNKGDL